MRMELERVRRVFPSFNTIALTEEDFWKAAKRERIIVKEMPLLVDGYYQRKRDKHFVLINSRLNGIRWLHTALHEFSHYLFDEPCGLDGDTLYRRGDSLGDPREKRADAFALIGLLPYPDLARLELEDLHDDPWLANLVRDRIAIFAEYGI